MYKRQPDDVELLDGMRKGTGLADVFGYQPDWGRLGDELAREITDIMVAGDFENAGTAAGDRETAKKEQPTR